MFLIPDYALNFKFKIVLYLSKSLIRFSPDHFQVRYSRFCQTLACHLNTNFVIREYFSSFNSKGHKCKNSSHFFAKIMVFK
jgi:hypothetical protein